VLARPERYASIVDVHVILRRDGKVLLLRRAGDTWASGRLCLPSGHLEEGEDILHAAVKHSELVWADPAALPPDTVDYTAALIAVVERGDTFALNGW
jgi:hypothetical protein